jgi:hypothetical protein
MAAIAFVIKPPRINAQTVRVMYAVAIVAIAPTSDINISNWLNSRKRMAFWSKYRFGDEKPVIIMPRAAAGKAYDRKS